MKTNQYNEPDVIFLQLHDPTDEGKTELADPKADGVTWCWEQIHHNDVEYIRKDLYDELKAQITAYQLTIANMEIAQQIPEGYALVDKTELKKIHRDLDACQKVIWYAGGFDEAYCKDAQESLKLIDAMLSASQPKGES